MGTQNEAADHPSKQARQQLQLQQSTAATAKQLQQSTTTANRSHSPHPENNH